MLKKMLKKMFKKMFVPKKCSYCGELILPFDFCHCLESDGYNEDFDENRLPGWLILTVKL